MSEMVAITQQDQLEELTKQQQQQQQHGQSYIHPPKDKKKVNQEGWRRLGASTWTCYWYSLLS
jgi:hypothetical protein